MDAVGNPRECQLSDGTHPLKPYKLYVKYDIYVDNYGRLDIKTAFSKDRVLGSSPNDDRIQGIKSNQSRHFLI